MTVRLFDELDTIPEPAKLPLCGNSISTCSDVCRCYQCRQIIEDGVYHINPETGDYDCTN